MAKCVEIDTFPDGMKVSASPVWEYTVNGKSYTYCNSIYDLFFEDAYEEYRKQMLGTTCELFVNSRKPSDVYAKVPDSFKKALTFIGIFFVLVLGL